MFNKYTRRQPHHRPGGGHDRVNELTLLGRRGREYLFHQPPFDNASHFFPVTLYFFFVYQGSLPGRRAVLFLS